MKHLFYSIIFLLIAVKSFATITITLKAPAAKYALTGTNFFVQGSITSTYEIASVTASVFTIQTALTVNTSNNTFQGYISLASFTQGDTLPLVVTVIDHFNNQQNDTIMFIYQNPPVITLAQPLNWSVAQPTAPFKLYCVDIDTCQLKILYGTTTIFTGNIKDSFSTTVNLSAFKNAALPLIAQVTDNYGQLSQTQDTDIYTLASPYTTNYYTANNKIFDFNYNRVLSIVTDSSRSPYGAYITDVSTNAHDTLAYPGVPALAYLTPVGAVFQSNTSNSTVTLWTVGTLYDTLSLMQEQYGGGRIETSGNYILYGRASSIGDSLFLVNISTGNDSLLTWHSFPTQCSVTSNGSFAYEYDGAENYGIYFHSNEGDKIITTNERDQGNDLYPGTVYPVTDGNYVLYRNDNPGNGGTYTPYAIFLYNGDSSIELAYYGSVEPQPGSNYQVNNKYVTYCAFDIANKTQVWLRDSAGNNTQLSFFGTNSIIDNMDASGNVIYINGNTRYYAATNGQTFALCTSSGTTYYRDSAWYLVIGREIYKINLPAALPLALLSFNAVKSSGANLLTWLCAAGSTFNYFGVENSTDGKNFTTIGQVAANAPGTYSFTHAKPQATLNYYRLKMVDKNGNYTYSGIRTVNNFVNFTASIYPNPVNDLLALNINSDRSINVQIQLTDMQGHVVTIQKVQLPAGQSKQNINTSTLSSGTYIISITSAGQKPVSYKFIKQ